MRSLLCCVSVAALMCGALAGVSAQAPKLQLTLQDGRVTLIAHDVTIRDVLQAWSRIGETKIVNGEKMLATRVNLQLTNVSEAEALDILLRSAAGYIAAPRPADRPGPSRYDRITILVSSVAPAATAAPVSAMAYPEGRGQPQPQPYAQPAPQYSAPADQDEAPAEAAPPPPVSLEGAQPAPSQTRPTGFPFAGMQTQLEGAQPSAKAWADLMKAQGQGQGAAPAQTVSRPGVLPGTGTNGRGGGGA